jgi:hypothetical protein
MLRGRRSRSDAFVSSHCVLSHCMAGLWLCCYVCRWRATGTGAVGAVGSSERVIWADALWVVCACGGWWDNCVQLWRCVGVEWPTEWGNHAEKLASCSWIMSQV